MLTVYQNMLDFYITLDLCITKDPAQKNNNSNALEGQHGLSGSKKHRGKEMAYSQLSPGIAF